VCELCSGSRIEDVKKCFDEALDVFPENEELSERYINFLTRCVSITN